MTLFNGIAVMLGLWTAIGFAVGVVFGKMIQSQSPGE